jgi:hypothetical protein
MSGLKNLKTAEKVRGIMIIFIPIIILYCFLETIYFRIKIGRYSSSKEVHRKID